METAPFASLAQLKILVLPVGSIKRPVFDKWAGLIRSFDQIRLENIPPDPRDDRARFLPPPLSNGSLHLSYPTHPPPTSQGPYALFRPSSFCLGVIGIADCSQSTSLASILAEFYASLAELFGPNPIFPLAGRCFAFDPGDGHSDLDVGGALEGLMVIPTEMGDNRIHLGTLLANLCGSIIGEFATLVRVLNTVPRIEELNNALLPTLSLDVEESGVSLKRLSSSSTVNGSKDTLPPLPRSPTFPVVSNGNGNPPGSLGLGLPSVISRSPSPFAKRSATLNTSSPVQGFKSRSASLAVPPLQKRKSVLIEFNFSNPRLGKICADLYLLSGRLNDAIKWYSDAVSTLKSASDAIWQASALEGLCVALMLDAWGRQDQPSIPPPGGSAEDSPQEVWLDIQEKLKLAVSLYWKATPNAPEGTNLAELELSAITTLYAESVVRLTRFLFAIWSSKGWGSRAFSTMMLSTVPRYFNPNLPTEGEMQRMTTLSTITRIQIARTAGELHGPFILRLLPFDRIRMLSFLASTFSCLGFRRKEVYILRELQASVTELIVGAREELSGLGSATLRSALTFHGYAQTPTIDAPERASGALGIRESELVDGNDSLIRLIRYVCEVYGIDLTVKILETREDEVEELKPHPELSNFDDTHLLFGWPELQVGVMRDAISIAEILPDHLTVAHLATSMLRRLGRFLPTAEQQHLYIVTAKALATARRRGDTRKLQYWSGHPVVSIEVAQLPLSRRPLEHSIRDLELGTSIPEQLQAGGLRDPFIYNPRLKSVGPEKFIAAQNETLEFVVTLRNTLPFDLDIHSLSLSTTGATFRSQPTALSLPASAYHVVKLSGVPIEAGTLTIYGCTVQIAGCAPRTFSLPLSAEADETRRQAKRISFEMDLESVKDVGLSSLPVAKASRRRPVSGLKDTSPKESPPRYLECTIIPDQPLMYVRRTSLAHGAVMLYDGETSTIRLTLENASTAPIDFLRVNFDDGTLLPTQNALAEGDLTIGEVYETEYELLNRPIFKWENPPERVDVLPGRTVALNILCLGKVGCTSGSVLISYAHAGIKDSSNPADRFYSRQIVYPVLVTVYQTLDCLSMDIIRSTLATGQSTKEETDVEQNMLRGLLNVDHGEDWCLLTVDVRNVFRIPFEVTLERSQDGVSAASSTQLIAPGSTSRMVLPLKRFFLPKRSVEEPIPNLLPRQFIVSKSRLSAEEQMDQRTLFWYREQLFKNVTASWKEPVSGRVGELSLRAQQLSVPMLEALRADMTRVDVFLEKDGEHRATITTEHSDIYTVPMNEFVYVRAKVTNIHSNIAHLVLSLTLIPPASLSYVLFEGSLTQIPLGEVQPGASVETELCLLFVAEGRYEWVVTVTAPGESDDVGTRELCIVVADTSNA